MYVYIDKHATSLSLCIEYRYLHHACLYNFLQFTSDFGVYGYVGRDLDLENSIRKGWTINSLFRVLPQSKPELPLAALDF